MTSQTNARFYWAADILAVKETDTILEIGCGTGLLAQLILEKRATGSLTAIDQSAAMIRMATKRNKESIAEGGAIFAIQDFLSFDPGKQRYNKILAFNVNIFWKEPRSALTAVKQSLGQKGRLYLFYELPYNANRKLEQQLVTSLIEQQFVITDKHYMGPQYASTFCLIAKRLDED